MALGQSFLFGVFLITITSFFHLDAPNYLESFLFLMKSSNSQCTTQYSSLVMRKTMWKYLEAPSFTLQLECWAEQKQRRSMFWSLLAAIRSVFGPFEDTTTVRCRLFNVRLTQKFCFDFVVQVCVIPNSRWFLNNFVLLKIYI